VVDHDGWISATDLVNGAGLPDLFRLAERRWGAAPHAAATLAWKAYTYWLALPAVLSWAASRRVPLLEPSNVLVDLHCESSPLLRIGLADLKLAVLPDDPLAGHPDVTVADDDELLLKMMRVSLLDHHLEPMAERVHERVKVGKHNLRGSIASGIAYGVIRAAAALPGDAEQTVTTLLRAFDLEDLVELMPGLAVQRKTCCLAFTLPEPKICSGCCLRKC
jgi:hypothetical protein